MNKIKSLLLGSAAVLLAATGAKAADLPAAPVAEPVEYVKVCPTYGAGFFYIPGTDTCLKIGGFVRFQLFAHESDIGHPNDDAGSAAWAGLAFIGPSAFNNGALYLQNVGTQQDNFALQGRMFLNFDARSETSLGTLRAFIAFRVGGGASSQQDNPAVQQAVAFLQFAGFTAGLAPSVLDFGNVTIFGDIIGDWNHDALQLAYTHQFGGGLSASIGIESPQLADTSVGYYGQGQTINFPGQPFDPFGLTGVCYSKNASFPANGAVIAGCETRTDLPDLTANIRVDQAWGSAMIGGVVRDVKSRVVLGSAVPTVPAILPTESTNYAEKTGEEVGWAVVGGVQIKLPMLAAGDQLILKGAYGQGAARYTNYGLEGTGGYPEARWSGVVPFRGTPARVGAAAVPFATFAGPFGLTPVDFLDFDTAPSWSVTGQLQHYWTPNLRSNLSVSWGGGDLESDLEFLTGGETWEMITAQGNLIWSPVKNLDVGLELIYSHGSVDRGALGAFGHTAFTAAGVPFGRLPTTAAAAVTPGSLLLDNKYDEDGFGAVFRIQRNF